MNAKPASLRKQGGESGGLGAESGESLWSGLVSGGRGQEAGDRLQEATFNPHHPNQHDRLPEAEEILVGLLGGLDGGLCCCLLVTSHGLILGLFLASDGIKRAHVMTVIKDE